jgi:hypothetical protein
MDLAEIKQKILDEIEAAAKDFVETNLADFSKEKLKSELHALVDKFVEEKVGDKLDGLADRLTANVIDRINGRDDIPNV